ncbi:MAG: glycosyltransferase [Acidilobus sp.]
MNQPYISVIVTAYNRRRHLPFALRSLRYSQASRTGTLSTWGLTQVTLLSTSSSTGQGR